MQEKIGRKVYDTEKSEYIGSQTVGFYGEDYGFQEMLYRKGKDDFFIVGVGGVNSPYPQETLAVLDMTATEEWLRRVLGDNNADEVLRKNSEESEAKKPSAAKSKKPASKKVVSKKTSSKKPSKKTSSKKLSHSSAQTEKTK